MDLTIIDIEPIRLAIREHRGPYDAMQGSVRDYMLWRREHCDPSVAYRSITISYDDPAITPPSEYRQDFGVEFAGPIAPNAWGVVEKIVPAMRCGLYRHLGGFDTMVARVREAYSQLLASGEQKGADYLFSHHVVVMAPEGFRACDQVIPESDFITDVYLPLAPR